MISARILGSRPQTIISILLAALALWFAYIVSGWISSEQDQTLVYAGLGAVLVCLGALILHNWRSGFYFFLVWLLFEDLIRKYLGNNMAVYFAKDIFAALTYLSFYLNWRRKKENSFRPPFLLFLGFFFWLAVVQVFNPNSPSAWYGLLGLKLYFYYVPMVFLGYALIRTDDDLRRFLSFNLVLATVISGLGIVQSIVGPTFLNPKDLDENIRVLSRLQRTAPITGELVNVPSAVFVSSGRYDWYLELSILVAFAAIAYFFLSKQRERFLAVVAAGFLGVAVWLCGSRGAIMYTAIGTVAILAGMYWSATIKSGQLQKLIRGARWFVLFASASVLLAALLFPKDLSSRLAFYSETLSPYSSQSELKYRTWDYPFENFYQAFQQPHWVLGTGTGTASLGSQYINQYLHEPSPELAVESGFGTLVIEMGILGLCFWFFWVGSLLIGSWRSVRMLKNTRLFPVGFTIWWTAFFVLIPLTFGGMAAYQNYVLNVYLWLYIGVAFRLPQLLRQDSSPDGSNSVPGVSRPASLRRWPLRPHPANLSATRCAR